MSQNKTRVELCEQIASALIEFSITLKAGSVSCESACEHIAVLRKRGISYKWENFKEAYDYHVDQWLEARLQRLINNHKNRKEKAEEKQTKNPKLHKKLSIEMEELASHIRIQYIPKLKRYSLN